MFSIKNIAKQTIKQEAEAVSELVNYVDEDFVKACGTIFSSKGRVVVTGIGKSANIGAKIVSTFNSTGTPAIFMHAAEAIHGDLGMIREQDVVICISKSGNTPEIKVLVPLIKATKCPLIAIVGDKSSVLAKSADYVLSCYVSQEADPNNLAPTCSTTAQLVIGDALAVVLLKMRGFSKEDFAKYHPGGSLGKRLYLKVSDIYPNNEKPQVGLSAPLNEVLMEISSKRLGCCAVVEDENIKGIITDGDLRRMLNRQKTSVPLSVSAKEIMTSSPKTIRKEDFAVKALETMRENQITQLLVVDEGNKYLGVVHLHDLIQEGII
ncbi:MAG: KpsF/GutQ family sugar-phosphate isomerase [Bacteroidales bacterium]|nr:KpsF/GutQ family sugar-phosphate isomerase [Bacteroidales bacterium]